MASTEEQLTGTRELDVSLIVVSYNTRRQTLECVEALLASESIASELIVVDNDSHDGTAEALRSSFPQVVLIAQRENLGFAKACNIGASRATGRYLGFFNSDCIAEPGCVPRLVRFLDTHPMAAIAAPRLLSAEDGVQISIQLLPTLRRVAAHHLLGRMPDPYRVAEVRRPTLVEMCSGAAMVVRRAPFLAVGGFHEGYFMYVEDIELCRRIRERGERIFYIPDALARHEEGASTGVQSKRLEAMLVRNREDYLRRTMPPLRAAAAITALRLGTAIAPQRTRVIATARRKFGSGSANDN